MKQKNEERVENTKRTTEMKREKGGVMKKESGRKLERQNIVGKRGTGTGTGREEEDVNTIFKIRKKI